jgi:hypothetical protein
MRPSLCFVIIATASIAAACGGSGGTPGLFTAARPGALQRARLGTNPISHVFIIVQENRSVDNLFPGLPGANTVSSGMAGSRSVKLQPRPIATATDLGHGLKSFLADTGCPDGSGACPMNGFTPPVKGNPGAYVYVNPKWTMPYFAMAEQYTFGDEMFASNVDASFVSHQYLVAAQSNGAVNFATPSASCGPLPTPAVATITQSRQIGPGESACFDYSTIIDELAAHQPPLPWRYYTAPAGPGWTVWWEPFGWIPHDQGAPGGAIVTPPSQFLRDISNKHRPYIVAVTWITPTLKNSDHAGGPTNGGGSGNLGPNWVASAVNAIGTSPLWNSSVIFITWDDWGGWYDHVPPPYMDYDGLGVRVPFIIISPYTREGLVTHVQYEHASILKYIEDLFGLSPLSAADARATDPLGDVMSNGSSLPRPFATIAHGPFAPDSHDFGAPDGDKDQ